MTYDDETTLGELIEKSWETQMSTQGKQMKAIGRRGRGVIEDIGIAETTAIARAS